MRAEVVCPHCGAVHPAEARICPATGQRLQPLRRGAPHRLDGSGPWLALGGLGVLLMLCGVGLIVLARAPAKAAIGIVQATSVSVPAISFTLPVTAPPIAAPAALPTQPTLAASPTATALLVPTTPAFTPSPAPLAPWAACAGARLSQLAVGLKAYVSFDPPLANRVREAPGRQARILGQIQPGTVVTILEGPGCANDWVWWRVQSNDGLVGWTAEGDANAYWLLPCRTQGDSECY